MSIIDAKELLTLPWLTLVTLACGYMAYFVANFGDREHHKTIDVIFSVFVFGFLSAWVYRGLVDQRTMGETGATIGAVLMAAASGAVWSWIGRDWLGIAVRKTNISHSNDLTTIHAEIARQKGKVNTTQLHVWLTDGSTLSCNDLSAFKHEPNGPFVLGSNGDLLMYVTTIWDKDGKESDQMANVKNGWGSLATIVPKEQIGRVEIRRQFNL